MSRIGKSTRTEKYISGLLESRGGQGGVTAEGYAVSFRSEENVLELESGDGHTTL